MNEDNENVEVAPAVPLTPPAIPQFPIDRIELNDILIPQFPPDRIEKGEKQSDFIKHSK